MSAYFKESLVHYKSTIFDDCLFSFMFAEEERLSSSTGEEAVGHGQSGVGEGRLQGSGN